jgi:hypothetical protein
VETAPYRNTGGASPQTKKGHVMTNQPTTPRRIEDERTRELERTEQRFHLACAQLAAGRAEPLRFAIARRDWPSHQRRFS